MSYKYLFNCDYAEGAHPAVLDALVRNNTSQEIGYGEDSYCKEAARLIKEKIQTPSAAVHFVSSGMQANIITLKAMVKSYEAVIAPRTSHINEHETGGLEAVGHKILATLAPNGKITPQEIRDIVEVHNFEHMVHPRAVCISQATEIGTVYSKKELQELSAVCKELGLYLYMDGARLGSALTATGADLTLPEIATLVDAFYIGGTKNGALLGEAIVLVNPALQEKFRYHIKQRGALLAKGRALGVQFIELFKGDLFFELARHENAMAARLVEGFKSRGYTFLAESPTNQIFPILPNTLIEKLEKEYGFYRWSKIDAHNSSIRLVTSWATPQTAVDSFLRDLDALKQ